MFRTFPVTDDDAYTGCLHSQCNATGKEEKEVEEKEMDEEEEVERRDLAKERKKQKFLRERTTES